MVTNLDEGTSIVFYAGHGYEDGWDRSLKQVADRDRQPVILTAGRLRPHIDARGWYIQMGKGDRLLRSGSNGAVA